MSDNQYLCVKCINKVKRENEICHDCIKYTSPIIDWDQRKAELINLINNLREKSDKYDCIVSLSGGRDSSYALYYMSKVIKARVLAVTWDNKFLREQSWKNIECATKALNVDHLVLDFDDDYVYKLLMALFKSTGNPCRGCIFIPPFKILPLAIEKKIPLIITGFSSAQAGGLDYCNISDQIYQKKMFHKYYKSFGKLIHILLKHDYKQTKEYLLGFMGKYIGINANVDFYPLMISLSRFTNCSPIEMDDILIKNLNWKRGRDGLEHTSCVIEEVRGYIEARRNVTSIRDEISYLVRTGIINRDQGLDEARKLTLSGNEPPKEAMSAFIKRFRITKTEFEEYITGKTSLLMKLKLGVLIPKLSKLMRWYQGFPTRLTIKQIYTYIKKIIFFRNK
jgi:hypothetical protein